MPSTSQVFTALGTWLFVTLGLMHIAGLAVHAWMDAGSYYAQEKLQERTQAAQLVTMTASGLALVIYVYIQISQ